MLRDLVDQHSLVTCEPDARVEAVARMMADRDVGCILVVDNGKPIGMLTDRDIVVRCVAQRVDVSDCTVEQIMSESVAACHETDGLFDCIRMMRDHHVRRIPVVDDHGQAIGVISFGDIMGILAREMAMASEGTMPEDRGPEESDPFEFGDFRAA